MSRVLRKIVFFTNYWIQKYSKEAFPCVKLKNETWIVDLQLKKVGKAPISFKLELKRRCKPVKLASNYWNEKVASYF